MEKTHYVGCPPFKDDFVENCLLRIITAKMLIMIEDYTNTTITNYHFGTSPN